MNLEYCMTLSCLPSPFLFSLTCLFSATVAIITINTLTYSFNYTMRTAVVASGNIKHMTSVGIFFFFPGKDLPDSDLGCKYF